MSKICTKPFKKLEIACDGKIYTCCPVYIKYNCIGNLFDDNITSIDDIWNSEKAKAIRTNILQNDYSLCNLDICREKFLEENKGQYAIVSSLPEFVTLAYDKECNIQCITCRDKKIKNAKEQNEIFSKKINSILLPLLSNAKVIVISGAGEAFFSKHSRELIKKITKYNKDVKFHIYTNGILFNQNNCKELGLENRIENVSFSIHAFDEKIYNKIMIGSKQKIVLKNLKWAAEQQKLGKIGFLTINTVISALNYKEIPKLIELAKSVDAFICFSNYNPWGATLDERYKELAVWEKTNPLHNEFIKILKIAKEINYDKCSMPQIFQI